MSLHIAPLPGRGPLCAVLVAALALAAVPVSAGTVEVRLELPVRAKLDLEGHTSVTVMPFLVVSEEGSDPLAQRGIDVQKEFDRYLLRLLKRHTKLRVVESGPVDYPSYDMDDLASREDFWRFVGERTQADLILAGSLDFDIQDRSGYRTEEYISPFDGRTYYRQVLVEQTGFDYDIVMQIFDGRTGDLLHNDNFKDFKQFERERADPLVGMFENLAALEDRIAGIFTEKRVESSRLLFSR